MVDGVMTGTMNRCLRATLLSRHGPCALSIVRPKLTWKILASHHGRRILLTTPTTSPAHRVQPPSLRQATPDAILIMPGPKNTLLIEGSFEELTDEFAQYIDGLKKSQGDEASNLQGESADLLKENKKDEVLKKLVVGSQALNQAPEKGMAAISGVA